MPSSKELGHSKKLHAQESGQTLIEFLFLMLILIGLSFIMLRGFNSGITSQWKALVTIIAEPTNSTIEF